MKMSDRQIPIWVGEEEMSAALTSLCKQRPVAASKVKIAAKTALKYSNDYKMAVHSIESFIRKAAPMDKLCGVYVLDAICRQPKSQMFRERFSTRLKETVLLVNESVSAQDKPSFVRMVEEWDRKSLFENTQEKFASLVAQTGGGGGGIAVQAYKSNSKSLISSSYNTHPTVTDHAIDCQPSVAPTATVVVLSASAVAPMTVVHDPRKRKHEAPSSSSLSTGLIDTLPVGTELGESNILSKSVSDVSSTSAFNFFIHDLPAAGGRAALYVKMCPFADNCVFGDRCRCSHSDVLGFQPSYPFAQSKGRDAASSFGLCSSSILTPAEKIPLSAMTTKLIVSLNLQ